MFLLLSAYRNSNNFLLKVHIIPLFRQVKEDFAFMRVCFCVPFRPLHLLPTFFFYFHSTFAGPKCYQWKFLHWMHVQHKNFIRFLSIFFSLDSIQKLYLSTYFRLIFSFDFIFYHFSSGWYGSAQCLYGLNNISIHFNSITLISVHADEKQPGGIVQHFNNWRMD